ncbi:MAG: ABC transporter permease [Candidatus Gottesmanbacteria bacterium]|nr:ABC transporter permease [Candidatus Gottesmanbacteria bacterium]
MKNTELFPLTQTLSVALLFAKRDISSRYLGSILGPLWVIISPLATASITTMVFSVVFRHASEGVPYFFVVLSGLLSWGFFSASISHATRSLVINRHIILAHKFPLAAPVIGSIVGRIADYVIVLLFLFALLVFFGHSVSLTTFFFLPLVLILQLALQIGFGLMLAALNSYYRDVQNVVDVALQLVFYTTPILYPPSAIPQPYRMFIQFHPMSLAVEATRAILLTSRVPVYELLAFTVWSSVIITVGIYVFHKLARRMPDVI